MQDDSQSRRVFQQVKLRCVPLMENTLLTPNTTPTVSKLLTDLRDTLSATVASGFHLKASLTSYIFFPLSTILRRNAPTAIPDRVLELILETMAILCESWWWDCEPGVWEQIFMLCGSVVGGLEGRGKGKERDEETLDAATKCLLALAHERSPLDDLDPAHTIDRAQARQHLFRDLAQSERFIPIMGQTINALLEKALSQHLPLQRHSLQVLEAVIRIYAPESFVPSVLPGVTSVCAKVALGVSSKKGWANGDIVALALRLLQTLIVRAVGDDVCIREGAVRLATDLDDIVELVSGSSVDSDPVQRNLPRYATARTPAWLQGTSSQLHMAVNGLNSLVSHPTPAARLGLIEFSGTVLAATTLTLPRTRPLLLSMLLSMSISSFESVSTGAKSALSRLLNSSPNTRMSILQTLVQITHDNLSSLPRLLPSHSDAKVEHTAGLVEAVCWLSSLEGSASVIGVQSVSRGIAKLLGPSGGIEKWGWTLLSVLEFVDPPITLNRDSAARLMLEGNADVSVSMVFPEISLEYVWSRSTYAALVRMFRALGTAAGDDCLSAVEWFAAVGRGGMERRAVAALWCACRLLEGVAGVSLDAHEDTGIALQRRSRRLEKTARGLARSIAELWDEMDGVDDASPRAGPDQAEEDLSNTVEHVSTVAPIMTTLNFTPARQARARRHTSQPHLHRALCLHVLSITAMILQARFSPLLMYTLYPVLHSIVSPVSHLASTALATLHAIAHSCSYASPANLLLANFDYALDAVSRRLTRRWLDVDATKVLVVLVRLVGNDVVQKAGDVVEECFDRLDQFHGYDAVVDGLIEVLGEVIKVIQVDDEMTSDAQPLKAESRPSRKEIVDSLVLWYEHRLDSLEEEDKTDYGPAPREAWGKGKGKEDEGDVGPPENAEENQRPVDQEPPPTPTQTLATQIVSRSLYFLTHGSPVIRTRILALLASSVSVLPASALLPSIHKAWPFVLNRLNDAEPFVISATAALVEALVTHVGGFMYRRVWDDVWPHFRTMLQKLDSADASNALLRRTQGGIGTESAYTHSHRLYRSLLRTMTAVALGVDTQDAAVWQVILAFRRFLSRGAHEELQMSARELYIAMGRRNDDAVWLALESTTGRIADGGMAFLRESKWEIDANVDLVFQEIAAVR